MIRSKLSLLCLFFVFLFQVKTASGSIFSLKLQPSSFHSQLWDLWYIAFLVPIWMQNSQLERFAMRVGDIGLKTFAFRLEPNFVPIRLMSAIVYVFLQIMIHANNFYQSSFAMRNGVKRQPCEDGVCLKLWIRSSTGLVIIKNCLTEDQNLMFWGMIFFADFNYYR